MRYVFPRDFLWGAATSAFQVEGALDVDGCGSSQWSVFSKEKAHKIYGKASPFVACEHYYRYLEDVKLLAQMKHKTYRLSFAWPRMVTDGKRAINSKGIAFYHSLVDALLKVNIVPNVTLYHWDLPYSLSQEGGWTNPKTLEHYLFYVDLCFREFGDKVKMWGTFNEPAWTLFNGYIAGIHPPEQYLDYQQFIDASYHMMLGHAQACQLAAQYTDLSLGIAFNLYPMYPARGLQENVAASSVADGMINRWFLDAAFKGSFPEDIAHIYQKRSLNVPDTSVLSDLVDHYPMQWCGINYYFPHHIIPSLEDKITLNISGNKEKKTGIALAGFFKTVPNPLGEYTKWNWEVYPSGLLDLLEKVTQYNPQLDLYITENGIGDQETLDDNHTVKDFERIHFVKEHLKVVHRALEKGLRVKGYYMWSLMDNFSWLNGFKKRYGFLRIEPETLDRYRKYSSYWFEDLIKNGGFED